MPESAPSEAVVQAWARLVKAQHKVLGAVEADLKKAGFPSLAGYVMCCLRCGARQARAFGTSRSRRNSCSRSIMSRASSTVSRRWGLSHGGRVAEDGRGQFVMITPNGRDLLRLMWPAY